jgi:nicotinamide-nucleotide amidase
MKSPEILRAEVIAIGDELTTGARLDTNSQWLSRELGVLGIVVEFHTTACDTLAAGVECFRIAGGRADVVVATGGLGPTADDLTRDVLAAVSGEPLEESAAALAAIEARFTSRGVAMPATNRRQALFPRGTRIIPNPDGTAPGLDLDLRPPGGRSCRVFALPGVPSEMKRMWRETVAPALAAARPEAATIVQRRLKCFGAGESAIEARLPDIVRRGREPLVGITAHEATITLRITARGRDVRECAAAITADEATIRDCLGELVYGVEDDEVEDAALAAVADAGLTLATAEIGTDGLIAALVSQAQARRGREAGLVFVGGRVLPAGGSTGDAGRLAADVKRDCNADVALAAGRRRPGPDGREIVDIVLDGPAGTTQVEHVLGGGPAVAGPRAAKTAVDLVRRTLAVRDPKGAAAP